MKKFNKRNYSRCRYSGEYIYPPTKAVKLKYLEEFLNKNGIYLISWDKKKVEEL